MLAIMQQGVLFALRVKGVDKMSEIFYFYPASAGVYRSLLMKISPILDREGLSFHIARPEERPQAEIPAICVAFEGGCEK